MSASLGIALPAALTRVLEAEGGQKLAQDAAPMPARVAAIWQQANQVQDYRSRLRIGQSFVHNICQWIPALCEAFYSAQKTT